MEPTYTPEEWRPVSGFEGRYEVSDLGHVRSIDRIIDYIHGRSGKACTRRAKGKVLSPGLRPSGHGHVMLGTTHTALVHALVAQAFLGSRPTPATEIRHLNGNPGDNRAVNLQYGSRSENAEDSKLHGTHFHAGLTVCKRGHDLTDQANLQKVAAGGKRTCLACRRDRAAMYRVGEQVTIKGECINGHPMTPENRYTNGSGRTRCKACVIEKRSTA